jgi:hypothetical protein
MAYNFQSGKNKIRLLMEYENVTQKVLIGNAELADLMSQRENMTSNLKMATVQEKAICVLWVGRDELIPWPPHSPDIMPHFFFLWGYVKDILCKIPFTSLDELKLRIVAAIETVTPQMLENTEYPEI